MLNIYADQMTNREKIMKTENYAEDEECACAEPSRKQSSFFRRYFWEGQTKQEKKKVLSLDEESSSNDSKKTRMKELHSKHRNWVAIGIPLVFMNIVYWLTAYRFNTFHLFLSHWELPVTMVFGALIAGMTSEGGGAVAFPVMTILLNIHPSTARDFSIMIQSTGMTCALFSIVYMKVLIEKKAVLFVTMGAIPGIIFGFEVLEKLLTASQKKMLFVSIWSSFAVALYRLNATHDRPTYSTIPRFRIWKAAILVLTGFVGGIFTTFAGTGVDICTFSVLTLLFRVSEKTVTPTTVVLMGVNSMIAFYWRAVWQGTVPALAYKYWIASCPIAFTFAPVGSFLGSHFHRLVLATLIYCIQLLSLAGWLLTMPSTKLVMVAACILAAGILFFTILSKQGERLMEKIEKDKGKTSKQQRLTLIDCEKLEPLCDKQ